MSCTESNGGVGWRALSVDSEVKEGLAQCVVQRAIIE